MPSVRLRACAWQAADNFSQCLQIAGQTKGTATERAFAWQLLSEPAQQVSCGLRRGTCKCLTCLCLHPTWPNLTSRLPGRAQRSIGLSLAPFMNLCCVQAPSETPEQVLHQLSAQDLPQPPSPTALQVCACHQLFDRCLSCSGLLATPALLITTYKAHYLKVLEAVAKLYS